MDERQGKIFGETIFHTLKFLPAFLSSHYLSNSPRYDFMKISIYLIQPRTNVLSLSSDQENSALEHYFQLVVLCRRKTSNRKHETSNKKTPTSFMSWYMVEYGQDSQTKVGAERANLELLEAVFGLFLKFLVSSKFLSECYLFCKEFP